MRSDLSPFIQRGKLRRVSQRVFGLDIVRAVAILLVVFGHMFNHSRLPAWLSNTSRGGGLGVEIFFVLSGFLIGGILVRLLDQGRLAGPSDLLTFWSRRWLRTLPLYYVFFFVYLWYDWLGPTTVQRQAAYLVFLQNFAWRIPGFFAHSWSLAVEEWFYLIFPACVWVIGGRKPEPKRALLLGIVAVFGASLVTRLGQPVYDNWSDFNDLVRSAVVPRLDSVMFGVLMAWIKRHQPGFWQGLRGATPFVALLAAGVWAYHYAGLPGLVGSRLLQVFLLTGESLVFALLLPFFDGIERPPSLPALRWFVEGTSRLSYSIYLGHILVITLVNQTLSARGLFEAVYWRPTLLFGLYLTLTYAFALVTYSCVERPFLVWRDRKHIAAT